MLTREKYLQKAQECLGFAENCASPELGSAWLKLSEQWMNMARQHGEFFPPQVDVFLEQSKGGPTETTTTLHEPPTE